MHHSQRPRLAEVRDWFAIPLTSDTLDASLATLRADPNWLVTAESSAAAQTLRLYYYPRGAWLTVVLRDEGGRWQPTVAGGTA